MDHGIAILPPAELSRKIRLLQCQFGDNGIEPHITVKAQGGLGDNLKWFELAKEIARKTPPIHVTLGDIKKFGNEVLYISVDSPGIITLHNEILDKLDLHDEIIERFFERDLFTPHLTLGRTQTGYKHEDFPKMKELAEELLANSETGFYATFMRVYSIEKGNCQPMTDLRFEG